MEVLGPADQPFLTRDNVLAYALYLAFVPFCDDAMPCVNYYTAQQLRELGYAGLLPQEAALRAVEDGRKGTLDYMFAMPDSNLIKVFEDQKQVIDKSEGLARDMIRGLIEDYSHGVRTYEETIVRVACTFIYMRAQFLVLWRKLEPLLRFDEGLETMQTQVDGSHVATYGGFKFIGARASKKTRERLGI